MDAQSDRLRAWLSSTAPATPLSRPDARLALGVLLVRIAKADKVYLFEELEQIDRVLAELNQYDPIRAAKTRALCEQLETSVRDTESFTSLIREAVSYDDRKHMVEALWSVVVADGIEQDQEVSLVEWIETALAVSPEDSAAAHTAARAAKGLSG